jgi:hypothetical protein
MSEANFGHCLLLEDVGAEYAWMLYPDDVMSGGGGTVGGRWYLKRHQNGEFQIRKLQNGNLQIDFSF